MLVVKTKIGPSNIEGIGLFADEFISKGTVIWRYHPQFDIYFDPSDVEKMQPEQKKLVLHVAYLSKKSGKYVYSIDNTGLTNHSIHPNSAENEGLSKDEAEICTVATRDIQIGEEITIDYRAIDAVDELGGEEYLNK